MALLCMGIVLVTALLGIFAPWVAPNDPYANDILNTFDSPSWQYPLGTDHLGRCVFSRMLFGIRPTLFLSLLTMLGTIGLGVIMGITAGYFRGTVDEVIMRVVDVMLSFPSQIIILAVVALLGVDIRNVVIASIFIKWAWYARMIRTATIKYTGMNFVLFSRSIGSGNFYILTRHMLPCIAAELAVLASLDTGWAILNISTLSFLGLGVQAPVPEWGAMLNEAKNVMVSNPEQMIVPGIAVVVLVGAFNMLGDCLRDALEPLRNNYDYIFIDCPPSLELLTLNALCAADEILIPVQCEYYALEGLSDLMTTMRAVKRRLNPTLGIFGVLLTMYDGRTNFSAQVAEEVRRHFPGKVFAAVIPRNVRLSEAPSHGLPIFAYDRFSRGAAAYDALVQEILTKGA